MKNFATRLTALCLLSFASLSFADCTVSEAKNNAIEDAKATARLQNEAYYRIFGNQAKVIVSDFQVGSASVDGKIVVFTVYKKEVKGTRPGNDGVSTQVSELTYDAKASGCYGEGLGVTVSPVK